MAQVAANQDRAERLRAGYVYQQQIVVRLRDGGGKLVREEASEYSVAPTPEGTRKELGAFAGKFKSKKGGMVAYDKSGLEAPDRRVDIDAGIVRELREELLDDASSRDGLGRSLFPLTTAQQSRYEFRYRGEEMFRGLPVHRISFRPKSKPKGDGLGTHGPWEGEVLVSRDDAQPVSVVTRLAKKVPAAVRTLLGTNLQGVGFSVVYQKFDDGVWFPVSFGTEFRVRVLFLYKRAISVSMVNGGFRRADVQSSVTFEDVR